MSEFQQRRKVTYCLFPTPRQSERVRSLLRQHQQPYNAALAERIGAWHKAGKSIRYADRCASLSIVRRALPEWTEANCSSRQMTLRRG